jgi:CRISPR/Cas system-associated exonuclease Cas4 (RecB family)
MPCGLDFLTLKAAPYGLGSLEKQGWKITHDPLKLELEEIRIEIDLGAERLIAAEKAEQKIAVEIKTFSSTSDIGSFHTALGQYLNYEDVLTQKNAARDLYLAVPEDTYLDFFQYKFVRRTLERYKIRLIVYSPISEEIVLWETNS